MYRRVLAFDFDGTLAVKGEIPPELVNALERCHALGHALFLVTGRLFKTITLGHLAKMFSGIVWENGAVLMHMGTGELYLPFGQLSVSLLKELEEHAIPFERGLAIASTWAQHEQEVWQVVTTQGGAVVEYNRGSMMLVPPGAAKGAGLDRLLTICGLSSRNLAAFGDGENDLSMLKLAEVAFAVGDAVPAVREVADVVAEKPGPAGVLEILDHYPLAGRYLDMVLTRERLISLGQNDTGDEVRIPASQLAGRNLGVFGGSGTGKSWMVGLLAEGMHHEGYQVLILDIEGDFRGLRSLPRFVSLEGDRLSMAAPSAVVALLEAGGVSVVLDLSRYPVVSRSSYIANLLRQLRPLRAHKYRPHWIVMEEAQQFLLSGGCEITAALMPLLAEGGCAFVTYRPDRLDSAVLHGVHHCLLTRLTDSEAVKTVREHCGDCGIKEANLEDIPTGSALLCGGQIVQLRPAIRRIRHVRHLHKYLDTPLPPYKRFWFCDTQGSVGMEAASLYEFLDLTPMLPLASLEFHDRRQDFVRWAESTLGDAGLANSLRQLSNRKIKGEPLREALQKTVAAHYEELQAL